MDAERGQGITMQEACTGDWLKKGNVVCKQLPAKGGLWRLKYYRNYPFRWNGNSPNYLIYNRN